MAPSLRSLLSFGGLFSQTSFLNNSPTTHINSAYTPLSDAPTCPGNSPLSCHNSTTAPNSCCFIYPGGQLLQTQFWDAEPTVGPVDSWTVHGLWPDLCDGTYPTFCTEAPTYYNITQILSESGNTELLDFMKTHWLPDRGTTEHFWEHEWNKHGTCVNTLAPSCYASYTPGAEVVDFFARAVQLFKSLDSYEALAAAGILPSRTRTYTLKEIEDALGGIKGQEVVLGCRRGNLMEAWYSFNVKGSLQTGEFVATAPAGKGGRGSCPQTGIKYLPKHDYRTEKIDI